MTDFSTALNRLWPKGDQEVLGLRVGIIASAPAVFAKYGINNDLVLAHLMAQISHECGAGRDIVENLNYTAKRIMQVWPSRFRSLATAMAYERNPRALANKVYNGRMGNRPNSNDGWNFRGRGGCQTTGREGYERVKKQTGFDVVENPDLLIDPAYFLECAVSDFISCGCLPYAKADDVSNVTKLLNCGTTLINEDKVIGLKERKAWLEKWKKLQVPVPTLSIVILPSEPKPPPPDIPKPVLPPAPAPSLWSVFVSFITIFFKGRDK